VGEVSFLGAEGGYVKGKGKWDKAGSKRKGDIELVDEELRNRLRNCIQRVYRLLIIQLSGTILVMKRRRGVGCCYKLS
jgi:hypothetical protein